MSWISKLFGGGTGHQAPQSADPVEYKGFRIIAEPMNENGQYRLAGWIELDANGETRKHHFIRADLLRAQDEAEEASVNKAKQMIDQLGQSLFD